MNGSFFCNIGTDRKFKKMNRLVVIVFLIFTACSSKKEQHQELEGPLFELISPEETKVLFSNDLIENNANNSFKYEYFYNGGGVSIGDINNDGLSDIYFTGNMVPDKLYLNKGDLIFEDITDQAIKSGNEGWHTGTTMADVNGDGWLDIYVCRAGYKGGTDVKANLLYINNGDLTFTESAKKYGLADTLLSTQASFFDYDLDGDLDVYVVNIPNQMFSYTNQQYFDLFKSRKNQSDHFYKNDNGKFVDFSYPTRINNHAFGLGISVSDIDNDGYPDIYVSNDYEVRDYLFMNRNGVFIEELQQRTKHTSNFGMGTDAADFNNDGDIDIIEMDMAYPTHVRSKRNMETMSSKKFWNNVKNGNHFQYMVNSLQLNNGDATFSEMGQLAGVSKTDWSWGTLFADFDNDGLKDIVITNGHKRDLTDQDFQQELREKIKEKGQLSIDEVFSFAPETKVNNFIFRNSGNLTFDNSTQDWGFDKEVNSNGIAYGDLDNDGDLDLVINNLGEVASIYENKNNGTQNYLSIELKGHLKNTLAIGSRVSIYFEGKKQVQELFMTRGYQSSVDNKLVFGLGQTNIIDKVEVRWPNQKMTIFENVDANQQLIIDYTISDFIIPNQAETEPIFKEVTDAIQIDYAHQENPFNDFDRELLLPHILSRQGPCIAVGDINNDGLDDLFLGGAKALAASLFYQTPNGQFLQTNVPDFLKDKESEDLGALFVDVDNDNDLDLYVTSGGNDCDEKDRALQDRLYVNDGTGRFTKSIQALPKMITSTKVVRAADFDNDGDQDLFIGGRLVPGKYPFASRSYLLENNEGEFTDVTKKYSEDLMFPGMVTGAVFEDINGDGKIDLTLVGEWMGFTSFMNRATHFEKQNVLKASEGLWFSLLATDIDKDGDVDFIAGNLGANSKFKASKEKPLNIYGHDFDNNGSLDIVLSSYEGSINYPLRGKECSSEQMPFIKDKFPTYKDFAEADMNQLYGDKMDKALHLTASTLHSCIFINDGQGNFEMKYLPNEAQLSPIMGIQVDDINKDGNLDILGVGNMHGAEVETVRYDAGRGVCLLGDSKGNFQSISPKESGFMDWENSKALAKIKIGEQQAYLIGVNNDKVKIFTKVKTE